IERVSKREGGVQQLTDQDAIRLVHRIDWRTDGVLNGEAAVRGQYFLATVNHVTGRATGLRVWDGETGKYLWDHPNAAQARFSPTGELVYVMEQQVNNGPTILWAHQTSTGKQVREICRWPTFAHNFVVSADGEHVALYTSGQPKPVSLWSVA